MAVNVTSIRDTKWLTLEVCREFQRGTCSRPDSECKFAHPAKSCQVENGRVIACFDSLKGRCSRENCKYLHPPPHLKTQLEINGRNNLIQQKNMAMLAQQMQLANAMMPGTQLQPVPMFSVTPSLATNVNAAAAAAAAFNPYLGPVSPGLMPADILPSAPVLVTSNPNVPVPAAAAAAAQKLMRTDRLEVCREYQRGNCTRGENDCRFAHPADSTMIDTNDNTVTVCMDYIKGRCSREKCKYFHPPAHLQAKIKAAQHQVNQAAAAAAMGLPPVLPPLPKRPALEKANGATTMFNAGVFQYQQALANMQFQQQAAFIPSDFTVNISCSYRRQLDLSTVIKSIDSKSQMSCMWGVLARDPPLPPDTMTTDLNLTSLLNVTDLHNHTRGCSLTKTGFQFYYLPTVYIMVFITGLVGNSLAIWMFVCHMRPWSSISVYMFNLALADFCYVLSLPFLIFYYFNKTDWIFGDVLYTGVVHPLKSLGRLKKKNAVITSALVWVVVVIGISPILYYSRTGLKRNATICYDTTTEDELPEIHPPGHHRSIFVLAVFAVSYLPFHVMKNLNMRARLYFQSPDMCDFNNRVYATYQVTRGLASLNSCVDPILYFLAGDTFRRKLSRATKKPSRKGDHVLQSKSEETALNSLAEYMENGDRRL
ncbi:hypothetical protein L3Q82_018747 [Scortum barcoo]|uniref:Uncharacterized protein n=1 Tax=Scortum barcoo TaxID=214431 RepID=A0ACB8VFN8_9TELE|nr:hypothetical protein L3Q82_018747 [Scortum barcoo]